MKLDGIFHDLEHLYDFQTIAYGSHFVFFKMRPIFCTDRLNIPSKFGEDIFINEGDIKVFVFCV